MNSPLLHQQDFTVKQSNAARSANQIETEQYMHPISVYISYLFIQKTMATK